MHKPSTCGFVSTNSGMLGGPRSSPVIRHGFEVAEWAKARSAPIMGPSPVEQQPGAWRTALRERKAADGGTRDVPGGALERRAALPPPSRGARPAGSAGHRGAPTPWARVRTGPAGLVGHRGPIALESVPHPRRRPRKVFPKLSLHRRGSSRIVLFRTGA